MQTRLELLEIAKNMYETKLVAGYSGNISVCDRTNHTVIITPSSLGYKTMKVEDLMVIDFEGNIIEGKHEPSSEWRMHVQIYKNYPDVNAVVHTHSSYATGFAVQQRSIPIILIEMVPFIGGDIPVAKFELPGTVALGEEVSTALKGRQGCLLANHGVVAIGENLQDAYVVAEYIEDAATIYHHALSTGEPILINESDVEKMLE